MKRIVLGLLLAVAANVIGQDQKAMFKEWENAELTHMNSSSTIKYTLQLRNWDDAYMWNACIVAEGKTPGVSDGFYAVPEQQPHPIFLTNGGDWGDDKMIYFKNFVSQGGNYYSTSLVIVNDLLYKISEKKDHTWEVKHVYSKDNFKGVKGVIALTKKVKELEKMDHDKIVNDYINSQKETLESKTAAYKEKHKDYYERFSLEKGWANQDIVDGQEWLKKQRITNAVRVQNNSSVTVYIGFNGPGSLGYDGVIKPGSEVSLQCNLSDIYRLDGENGNALNKLFTPSKMCGEKYIIE